MKEAMKLLDALRANYSDAIYDTSPRLAEHFEKDITALREALAEQPAQIAGFDVVLDSSMSPNTMKFVQPEQREPVAAQSVMTVRIWRDKNSDQNAEFKNWHKLPDGEHILYTSSAQRKPLMEEEMFEAIRPLYSSDKAARLAVSHSKDEYRAIEAAHGIFKDE